MRSIAVLALLSCALVLPVANAQSDGCMTALEVLEDTPALSNLLTVVQAANLETSLNTSLRVTLFAPNNAALQPVLDRSNESAIADALASIVLYHIVPGQVFTVDDVLNTFAAANASTVGPLQTAAVQLPPSCGVTTLSLEDDNSGSILVVAAESSAEVVTQDVPICGGIVHIVDETLLPCELPPAPTDNPTPTAAPTNAPTATPIPTDGATPTPAPTDDARFGSGLAMSLLGMVFISALAVLA